MMICNVTMNTSVVFLAAVPHQKLSEKLGEMLWLAYGGPIKLVCIVGLIIFVAAPIFMFLKKLTR